MRPTYSIQRVTPDIAREYLARKRPNARPSPTAVSTFAQSMKAGEWILNGMPIIFSRDGVLIDGVARLMACVQADVPFDTILAQNIDESVLHTLDQHRRRSYAGVLESRGWQHASAVQSTLIKLCRIQDGAMLKANYTVPWTRLDRVIATNEEGIRTAVKYGLEHPAKALPDTIRCPLAFMGLQSDPLALHRLLEAVYKPAQYDASEPGVLLRGRLDAAKGHRISPIEMMALAIKALNDTIRPPKKRPTTYSWLAPSADREGDDFPQVWGYRGMKDPLPLEDHLGRADASLPADHEIDEAYPEIKFNEETITPAIAQQYLQHNSANRKMVRTHIDTLVRDIKDGNWALNAQPICFSSAGKLLNGQHRLSAVIIAQQPIECFVMRGLPGRAYDTYDIQPKKPADIEDMILTTGDRNMVRAAVGLIWNREVNVEHGKSRPSATEIRNTLAQHEGLLEWRHWARRNQKDFGRASTLMYCAYCMARDDIDRAKFFTEKLETSENLPKNHPILLLRKKLTRSYNASKGTGITDQDVLIDTMLSTWEGWLASERRAEHQQRPARLPLDDARP